MLESLAPKKTDYNYLLIINISAMCLVFLSRSVDKKKA
jgi:hypothetical protein